MWLFFYLYFGSVIQLVFDLATFIGMKTETEKTQAAFIDDDIQN